MEFIKRVFFAKYCARIHLIVLALAVIVYCALYVYWRGGNDFDYLMFVQEWPHAHSRQWKEAKKIGDVSYPTLSHAWNIRAIKPMRNGNREVAYCSSVEYNPQDLVSFDSEINVYLTPTRSRNRNAVKEELWSRYGTCVAQILPLRFVYDYFKQALLWAKKYNAKDILDGASVQPGNFYFLHDITKAITDEVKVAPSIECVRDPVKKTYFLARIGICFGKNLKLRDCEPVSKSVECPYYSKILYPTLKLEVASERDFCSYLLRFLKFY